jgi:hypothetical protein
MKNLYFLLILFLFNTYIFAQPVNDTCVDSINIAISTASSSTVTFDLSSAISNFESGCASSAADNYVDIWYDFIMPVNGNIYINGSIYWNKFQLLDACNGNEINCLNNRGMFNNLIAGNSYKLRVYRYNSNATSGYNSFSIQAFEQALNIDCTNSENITVTTAATTSIDFELRKTLSNLENGCVGSTQSNYNNLWYDFVMPVNGNIYIDGVISWNKFQILDACNGNEINCLNGSGEFENLIAGNSYKLRVYRSDSNIANTYRTFTIQAFKHAINDDCANSENILVSTASETIINFELKEANSNLENGCIGSTPVDYNDLWYHFIMPVDGNIYIDGSVNWNKFQILDACNGNEINCLSSSGFAYSLIGGNSYKIRLYRKTSDIANNYKDFSIQAFIQTTNDFCNTSENITVSTSSATDVSFSLEGAVSNFETGCDGSSNADYHDVWFDFIMPVDGNIYINGNISWNRFQLLDACAGTEINCFNGSSYFYSLTAGNSYKLRVYRTVSTSVNGFQSFTIQAIETATNNSCLDAINLNVGIYDENKLTKTLFGATASGETPAPSCGIFTSGEDVWYTVQVPSSGNLTIETSLVTDSTLNDTVLQVFDGSCGSLSEISCDNNSGDNSFSKILLTGRTPNETLYIRLFENGNNIADYYSIFAYDPICTTKTVWNGVWSNGTPDNTKMVIFETNYNTNIANIDACIIVIRDTAMLTVNATQYIKTENDLINDGSILIDHQASFVQVNDNAFLIGSGSYSTIIKTQELLDARYTYFSSPVQNEHVAVFSPWAQMNRIYTFETGATQDWVQVNAANVMTPGKGYIVRPPNPVVFNTPSTGTPTSFIGTTTFTKTFNNGIITHPLTFNGIGNDDDNELVGNPYPSAIVTAQVLTDNPSANAFYFWTHDNPETGGAWIDDYAIYNSMGYTSGNATTPAPLHIASGQGFFVEAQAVGDITFSNSQRVTGNNNTFLKTTDLNIDKIWINLETIDGVKSQLLIGFNNIGTDGFDPQFDAARYTSDNTINFFSTGTDLRTERLAIQTRGELSSSETIIPLGFTIDNLAISDLLIKIDHFENLIDTDIFINDLDLNILHNLKLSPYSFTHNTVETNTSRFKLIFRTNTLTNNDVNIDNDELIITRPNSNQIGLKTKNKSIIKKIAIYNTIGKQIWSSEHNQTNIFIHPNINKSEILFFKVQLENKRILHKKFIKL